MKTIILFSLILCAAAVNCIAQDIITKRSSENLKVKVTEVTPGYIVYKKSDAPDDTTFTISKSDVLMVRYADGREEIFVGSQSSSDEMAKIGHRDAMANYKGRNSGAILTAASAILSPLIAIIPAVACSASEPNNANLKIKNPELMKNEAYSRAYVESAYKIKKHKIWKSYLVGSGAWVVLFLVLSSV